MHTCKENLISQTCTDVSHFIPIHTEVRASSFLSEENGVHLFWCTSFSKSKFYREVFHD